MIEWMTLEQMMLMMCIVIICLGITVVCALKLCRNSTEEEMTFEDGQNQPSPLTFRNLARRLDTKITKRKKTEVETTSASDNSYSSKRESYMYSGETPSFK